MSAPRLSSLSGRTVVIEWNPPSVPNGVILKYVIQRRVVGGGNPSDVAEVNASLPLRYEDNTAQPVTNYQYRVIAYNTGPGEPSPYGNITTGEGGMKLMKSNTNACFIFYLKAAVEDYLAVVYYTSLW